MLTSFAYIGLFLLVSIFFALTMIGTPIALRALKLGANHPNPTKQSTFECGLETIGKTWVQFNFRYYYYALLFLLIDILVVFLYPWAVSLRALGYAGLIEVGVLLAIITVGYVYAWKKKALEWK